MVWVVEMEEEVQGMEEAHKEAIEDEKVVKVVDIEQGMDIEKEEMVRAVVDVEVEMVGTLRHTLNHMELPDIEP